MKTPILSTMIFLLCLSIFSGCEEEKQEQEEVDYKEIQNELKATEVEVATALRKDFELLVNTTGKIEASKEVIIPFEAGGMIESMPIKNGQLVREGQILAQMETEKDQLNIEKAYISLERAQFDFEQDSLGVNSKDWNEIIKDNLTKKNGIPGIRLSIKEAEMILMDKTMKAPMSGVIANLEIREGNIASAGKELCRIYDPNSLMLRAKILESDIALVRPGQKVDIVPSSRNAGLYEGTVEEINPFVDENGMVTVRIKIQGSEGLLVGMNANAVIRIPQTENIIVPKQAVTPRSGGRPVVFTVVNNRAKWNYVEVGLDNGREIEILEGVKEGDIVILTNNLQLGHDAAVSIASPVRPGSIENQE
jgi:multidrug efflux pump subunit AcrA (membrane-fusion protein)